jgi:hypothetical protein
MRNKFVSFLLLVSITGCANYSKTPNPATSTPQFSISKTETPLVTITPFSRPSYELKIVNPPPLEVGLPDLIVADNGTLYLTREKGTISSYSKAILSTNTGCIVDRVTATYSPDYEYVTIAKHCIAMEDMEDVYLLHSDGIGLVRTIVGYDTYEGGTNRPIEWAPDSKSLLYFRSAGFSDAHIEIFTGIFRYDIETAERKYLAPMWGQFKWSPDGKWIAILDARSNNECKVLYLLDPQGTRLWELDSICEDVDTSTEILWQTAENSSKILVVIQKERENQNIIATKEYETENLSSYRQVPIQ